jgi:hypothetical protein
MNAHHGGSCRRVVGVGTGVRWHQPEPDGNGRLDDGSWARWQQRLVGRLAGRGSIRRGWVTGGSPTGRGRSERRRVIGGRGSRRQRRVICRGRIRRGRLERRRLVGGSGSRRQQRLVGRLAGRGSIRRGWLERGSGRRRLRCTASGGRKPLRGESQHRWAAEQCRLQLGGGPASVLSRDGGLRARVMAGHPAREQLRYSAAARRLPVVPSCFGLDLH